MKVAILGAGAGGYTYAADLTLLGNTVNLFEMPFLKTEIEPVIKHGGIEIVPFGEEPTTALSSPLEERLPGFGPERSGFAEINKATTDVKEAIKDVEVILNICPSIYYDAFAEHTIPHLEDGQIVITCGKGLGSLHWYNVAKEAGFDKDVVFGELNSLGYGCTRLGRIFGEEYGNKVRIEGSSKTAMIGAFPGKNAEKAAEAYGTMYYGTRTMKPIPNALEGLLLDYNAITHPPPMICNAGRVGTGDRSFHIFGKDSAIEPVCRMMEKLDLERIAIGKALGFSESSPACTTIPMLLKGWLIIDKELTYYNAIHTWFLEICEGPFSLKTRYLIEDIPMGLRLWSSLGDMLDVPTPVSDAIITVVSILLDEDYWKTGRVVETLGIDPSWTLEQLNRFMEEGEI